MKETFNNATNSIIISSLLAMLVGIIMIAFPTISIETIGIIAAIYIIVHGFALIYLDFMASQYFLPFDGLFSGIISILVGIILLFRPSIIPVVFTIVIGIWMILSSINYIKIALKLIKTKLPWLSILLLGICDLLVGIIMIFNPFEATLSLNLFAGIMIIVHSVINIIDMIIIKKDVKDITKEFNKKIKELAK